MWVGVPILSGCGFCGWRGVAIWAWGIWGFPGGGFLGGFGAGAATLAWMGYWWLWMLFLWRRHAALLGMPVPADVGCQPGGRTVPELVRGGFGDLGALCLRVGVTAGPGGLGSWLVCRREHGLVHALGPGSGVGVFDASVPPQGGSNRGGVNGLYLGVLLSYVVWELTGWWGGVVFPLLWGLMGRPGLPWALVRMGLAPRPGQIWGNGGAYGGQRGSWLQRGGYFAPSDAFLPIPKASLLPLHHTNT